MQTQHDFTACKPISIWNQDLNFSISSIFKPLGKALISGVFSDGKGVSENLFEVLSSFGPEQKAEHATWVLIINSLSNTLIKLLPEYEEFFNKELNESDIDSFSSILEESLNQIEIGINTDLFDRPQNLSLLIEIAPPMKQWLQSLGMKVNEAEAFYERLKQNFILSLHEEWIANKDYYLCIENRIRSPFLEATKTERSWKTYNVWLQEQANQRMFAEVFSLKQVYVPLRAYYEIKGQNCTDLEEKAGLKYNVEKHVVDLYTEIKSWVDSFDKNNAIRVISGGPGSGKSSFAKIFAATMAEKHSDLPILFIPLHHFDPSNDLTASVEQFIRDERYLSGSPLDLHNGKNRLLIIFDGLDELSMQGKAAAETANNFIEEVTSKINRYNDQGCKRQVLITGRDVAVQSTSNKLRYEKQILHILPYFIDKKDQGDFVCHKGLLEKDQRDIWWRNYSIAKGLNFFSIPEELKIDRLIPITKEPLLNYLVALSYERNSVEFSDETTLNAIYNDLLEAVHERQWDHGSHKGAKELNLNQFIRILEEIALAVWHGNGRVATLNQILAQCNNSNLSGYLESFQESAKKGVTRLLTAFYFRQSDQLHEGEKTFEFTHKSFGEYLISRRIVRTVQQVHDELLRHNENPDTGYNIDMALTQWLKVCGPAPIDKYVFTFLRNEIRLNFENSKHWQSTFSNLIGFSIRNSIPVEKLNLPNFHTMMDHARNAEESLMVIHHACALTTNLTSKINYGERNTAIGEWINRIRGQRQNAFLNRLILRSLTHLELDGSKLHIIDLWGSDLSYSKGSGIELILANLGRANLSNINFSDVNLSQCFLNSANMREAKLSKANFNGANLKMAYLKGATFLDTTFRKANLERANLEEANLGGANLEGANLEGANLEGANLEGANLEGANLEGANLKGVNLVGANFERANLREANFEETNFEKANFKGAILIEANFEGANFQQANFKGAIFHGNKLLKRKRQLR